MEYDFIIKFENLDMEQNFMMSILELKDIIYLHKIHQNSRILSLAEKKKYYQMLSKTDFDHLIEIYKHDFYLFDYIPGPYF